MQTIHERAVAELRPTDQIKLALRARGLTLSDVARGAGVSLSWISQYLSGTLTGDGHSARSALARALGVRESDIADLVEKS